MGSRKGSIWLRGKTMNNLEHMSLETSETEMQRRK